MLVAFARSRTGFLETHIELRYSCAFLAGSLFGSSENIETQNTTGGLGHRPAANQIELCHATLLRDASIAQNPFLMDAIHNTADQPQTLNPKPCNIVSSKRRKPGRPSSQAPPGPRSTLLITPLITTHEPPSKRTHIHHAPCALGAEALAS